tara:strand:+ start:90 stop:359 length:270 start_codon:yes stop_codon:yes gene_type:complete
MSNERTCKKEIRRYQTTHLKRFVATSALLYFSISRSLRVIPDQHARHLHKRSRRENEKEKEREKKAPSKKYDGTDEPLLNAERKIYIYI